VSMSARSMRSMSMAVESDLTDFRFYRFSCGHFERL